MVLTVDDLLPVQELRGALVQIHAPLVAAFGREPLWTLDCWHEHDGFLTEATSTDWTSLGEHLRSDAALYAARSGDDHVFRAYFPESFVFLLRFETSEEDDDEQYPGIWGAFDLVGPSSLVEKISSGLPEFPLSARKKLPPNMTQAMTRLQMHPAGEWFDERWAG